jgi:hypothetical protein
MPRWCYRLMGGTAATPLASLLSMHRELWRCAECSEVTNNVRPPHKMGNEKSASIYQCDCGPGIPTVALVLTH